eukprot:137630-Hanusia_phi.AAC.1
MSASELHPFTCLLLLLSLPSFLQLDDEPYLLRPDHINSNKGGVPLIRPPNPLQPPQAVHEGLWEGVELVNAAGLPRSPDDDLYPPGNNPAPVLFAGQLPLGQVKPEQGSWRWKGSGKQEAPEVERQGLELDEKEVVR